MLLAFDPALLRFLNYKNLIYKYLYPHGYIQTQKLITKYMKDEQYSSGNIQSVIYS